MRPRTAFYGWAQAGTAADGTTITKKQCGGLPSLISAAGYGVLIPIYKHLSQLYVHATALSMQGDGGSGQIGHVHIGPNPHEPDLEFLSKSSTNPSQQKLRQHLLDRDQPGKTQPVWTRCNRYTAFKEAALTGSALYKLVKRIARHAGLGYDKDTFWLSPPVLRKTGASLAVAAGVSPHIAQQQLGHGRLETTKRHYLHLPVVEPLRAFGPVLSSAKDYLAGLTVRVPGRASPRPNQSNTSRAAFSRHGDVSPPSSTS